MELNGNEVNVIMEIPNQEFVFIDDTVVDDENVTMKFTEKLHGTIYIVADLFEDDGLLMPFGLPDGCATGKIAYWKHFLRFQELWNGIVEFKKSICKEED